MNWLFSSHRNGAQARAAIYSLIETAKANRLKPYECFGFLLDRLPYAESKDDYKKLLPHFVDPALLTIP